MNEPAAREVTFADATAKARYLDGAAALDATTRPVRDLAAQFADIQNPGDRAREIHRWVRDCIRYRRDRVNGLRCEELADAATVIGRGYDDCDGKARTFVALCRCFKDLRAKIRAIMQPVGGELDFTHVQALVAWPGSELDPRADANGWILAECIVRNCELGQDPRTCARPGGHWLT